MVQQRELHYLEARLLVFSVQSAESHPGLRLPADITWLKEESEIETGTLPDPDTLIAKLVDELTAAAKELAAAASPSKAA